MPEWISTLVRKVTGAPDPAYRVTPSAAVIEKDPSVLLDEIAKILAGTYQTLQLHKDMLPVQDYEAFLSQYKIFHLDLQEEFGYGRELNPELVRQGRVPSETSESKESVQGRALDLLGDVEEYNKKVTTASRRANVIPASAFPDEQPQKVESPPIETNIGASVEETPSTLSISSRSSSSISTITPPAPKPLSDLPPFVRSNVGLMKRLDFRPTARFSSTITAVAPSLLDDPNCVMAIAHVLQENVQASSPAKKVYRRDVSFRHGGGIVTISDPQLHELDDAHIVLGPVEMFALQDLIQKWYSEILAR
ncbi:hypothetical protein RhiJN_00211 [Ceratobasidium sp. AG-Ba]|nr:hypothetical protein RhiJN_00204 [Ceratobasidium sp. AG-Ba]QRV72197.1 hypothetical protein RhiJN_00211 [Ceratobasidium sp. AG-Ba]QRW01236.1 hypothetical protein RhiLY_00233 [Ceratobasidium sp. AG-Ba]QRW01243.1 hypothetical protein RhiLY_00240 [Ceratobasidium sp. AG-Ba]